MCFLSYSGPENGVPSLNMYLQINAPDVIYKTFMTYAPFTIKKNVSKRKIVIEV